MNEEQTKQILAEALLIKYTGDYKSVDFEDAQVGATDSGSSPDTSSTVNPSNSKSSQDS